MDELSQHDFDFFEEKHLFKHFNSKHAIEDLIELKRKIFVHKMTRDIGDLYQSFDPTAKLAESYHTAIALYFPEMEYLRNSATRFLKRAESTKSEGLKKFYLKWSNEQNVKLETLINKTNNLFQQSTKHQAKAEVIAQNMKEIKKTYEKGLENKIKSFTYITILIRALFLFLALVFAFVMEENSDYLKGKLPYSYVSIWVVIVFFTLNLLYDFFAERIKDMFLKRIIRKEFDILKKSV